MFTQAMKLGTVVLLLTCGAAEAADSLESRLFGLSSRWDRVKDTDSTISPECSATAFDSYNDVVPYTVFEIQVTEFEALDVVVTPLVPEGILLDPVVAVYCAPFDRADPVANLVAVDDDGRGAPKAGFFSDQGVFLEADTPYFLVVTCYGTFEGVQYGTFRVDLGGTAYFSGAPCPLDLNESRSIDYGDLMAVLMAWGPCEGCPEDVNGDDVVDIRDLLTVLMAWGACD